LTDVRESDFKNKEIKEYKSVLGLHVLGLAYC